MLPTGPHNETEADKLWSSFLSCLTILRSLNREILESNSARIFPENENIEDRKTFIVDWLVLKKAAEKMPEITPEITLVESLRSPLQTFVTNFNVANNFRLGSSSNNLRSISAIVNPLQIISEVIELLYQGNINSKIPSAEPTEIPIGNRNIVNFIFSNRIFRL